MMSGEPIGQMLGLSNDFAVKMIKAVGNYGEIYERHFDSNLMPREANALSDDLGLQLSLPTTSIVVNQAIAPITVNEDAANTLIDLTKVFSDIDGDGIVKSVFSNNNTGLVTATINNNQLILDYLDNQSGTAKITVCGTSNGQFVDNAFTITVNPVNDTPSDITLNNAKISENALSNALIGRLTFCPLSY